MRILALNPKVVDFDPKDPDGVIRDFVQRCEDRGEIALWRLCFSGFDNDPRELIEIPAAQRFARRLIDLGLLITLEQPRPGNAYIIRNDNPGLDGLVVHAISRGAGEVKRRGKRVSVNFDIDIAAYFTCLLKTLKERGVAKVEEIIEIHSRFDPLKGSSKFAAESAFTDALQRQQPAW